MSRRKYVCFSKHGNFIFNSEHRLNSAGNKQDARMAFSYSAGKLYPAEDFTDIVNWKDYPIDGQAINW